jgi:hypothetical protein
VETPQKRATHDRMMNPTIQTTDPQNRLLHHHQPQILRRMNHTEVSETPQKRASPLCFIRRRIRTWEVSEYLAEVSERPTEVSEDLAADESQRG